MADLPDLEPTALPTVPNESVRDLLRNWADDQRVRTRVEHELIPLLQHIRNDRKPLSNMWTRLLKVWTLEHEAQGYRGRSNVYVPAGKKGTETIVSQLVSGSFPGDDNFGVDPTRPEFSKSAVHTKALLKHGVEKVARVRMQAELMFRQMSLTGNCPIKIHWDKKVLNGPTKRRRDDPSILHGAPEHVLFEGPVFRPIDIQSWYAFPHTAQSLDEAEIVFEDMTLSVGHLRRQAEAGFYRSEAVEKSARGDRNEEHEAGVRAKLESQGFQGLHDTSGNSRDTPGFVDVTEVYLDFDPDARSRDEELNPLPFVITVTSSGEVLRCSRNILWHQRPPYLLGRMGLLTGRLYGTGFVEAIRELQILLNDQTNQGMDCANYALNPTVLTNPSLILGTLPDLEPGVQFLVNDVNNAVKFDRPPMDLINGMSMLTTGTMSWINDFIGAPPVLQGGSSPGRAFRTATGIGTANQNARVPLQELVRLTEIEVFQPMLFMFWSLYSQFASDKFILNTGGPEVLRVGPEEIRGDYHFTWLASTQTANQQIKGSQLTQLIQLLANPQMAQLLQMNGLRINPAPLIRRLGYEVFGIRDMDEVMVQAALPAGPANGMPPEAGALGPGSAGGIPPGAGAGAMMNLPEELSGNGDFLATREGSDEISAMMGGIPPEEFM